MLNIAKYLAARLGESSTWASIAAALVLLHVSVDPGLWSTVTAYGVIVSGLLGAALRDASSKPAPRIAEDLIVAVAEAIKAKQAADVTVQTQVYVPPTSSTVTPNPNAAVLQNVTVAP